MSSVEPREYMSTYSGGMGAYFLLGDGSIDLFGDGSTSLGGSIPPGFAPLIWYSAGEHRCK